MLSCCKWKQMCVMTMGLWAAPWPSLTRACGHSVGAAPSQHLPWGSSITTPP